MRRMPARRRNRAQSLMVAGKGGIVSDGLFDANALNSLKEEMKNSPQEVPRRIGW